MKIVSVVGARPNFMKIAPLLRAIDKHNALNKPNPDEVEDPASHRDKPNKPNKPIHPLLVHTGQHYDYEMSQVFFRDLALPEPDVYLGVGSGTHAEQTGRVMIEFEKVLLEEKPDLVVVVGDVNSTLAAALAAVKLHGPVAHVEAGLRSGDRAMPEEINRLLTDAISDYLFTPSADADDNLKREGIPQEKIFFVGNVMIDSLLYNKPLAEKSDILQRLGLLTGRQSPMPPRVIAVSRSPEQSEAPAWQSQPITPYALLTLHRPRNVDDKHSLTNIMTAIAEISEWLPVVFPAHPRTQRKLEAFGLLHQSPITNHQLLITPPLSYLDFLRLEMCAAFVMTDSGGIQEETTVLNVPCLTLRDTTERPITITQGTNVLVGNSPQKIVEEASKILRGKVKKGSCPELWDGGAAERIVEIITSDRYN